MQNALRFLTLAALIAAATFTFAASPEPTTVTALQQALGPGVGLFEVKAGEVAVGLPYLKRIELSADSALVTVRNDRTAPLAPRLELCFYNQYGMRLCRTTASFESDAVPPGGVRAVQIALTFPNLVDIFAPSTVTLPSDWRAVRFASVRREDGEANKDQSATQSALKRPNPRPNLVRTAQAHPAIFAEKRFGTANIGPTAVDARWSNYGVYLQRMIDTVQIQWERTIIEQKANPVVGSSVTVKFVINNEGRIVDIGIENTTANETATWACASAITDRAPYGPWTDEMKVALGNKQTMTFTFYYQ